MPWCPRIIKEKTERTFSLADGKVDSGLDPLKDAINTERYTGSYKLNFFENTPIVGDITDDKI
jgi:hypothetical protein